MNRKSAPGGANQTEVHMRGKEWSCVNEQEKADPEVLLIAKFIV